MLIAKLIHQETDASAVNANRTGRVALLERCLGIGNTSFQLLPVYFPILLHSAHLKLVQNGGKLFRHIRT